MAGFRFRLQKLLNLKQQLEDKAKNELGLAMKAHELEKRKLALLDAGIVRISDDFRQACSGTIRPERIQAIRTWLEVQKTARGQQLDAVKKSGENVDKVRVKLVAAMQEKKILANLRDKEFEKFLKQEAHNEQKLTDELVSYRESVKITAEGMEGQ
ncbi:MAG TPA: flagellar export protein FliJ [Thermoclostridium caenicola]|uniref:flagellar export protein FliJ n=1 Tax=Thermoclostridium caenicola TaxID=659425 RepID=UPI002BC2A54B|nr:flagellar export protein FliJ [Thermoclostridium caenicola]HOK42045.1 flagellar export protein FliJ [Thermoclostridium caenicola]HOL85421.1 flagellar export protein FliJ [Thermoclostridium caenicola]HPO75836.1 flagellar export protein FliJ [Thermoclostridium caenicola]